MLVPPAGSSPTERAALYRIPAHRLLPLRIAFDDVADVAHGQLVGEVDRGEELADEDFPAGERADEVDDAKNVVSMGYLLGGMEAITQQRRVD